MSRKQKRALRASRHNLVHQGWTLSHDQKRAEQKRRHAYGSTDIPYAVLKGQRT